MLTGKQSLCQTLSTFDNVDDRNANRLVSRELKCFEWIAWVDYLHGCLFNLDPMRFFNYQFHRSNWLHCSFDWQAPESSDVPRGVFNALAVIRNRSVLR